MPTDDSRTPKTSGTSAPGMASGRLRPELWAAEVYWTDADGEEHVDLYRTSGGFIPTVDLLSNRDFLLAVARSLGKNARLVRYVRAEW